MYRKLFSALLLAFATAATCIAQTEETGDDNSGKGKELPTGIHMNEHGKPMKDQMSILSVSPFQFTESGVGFSVAYEHSIDPRGIVTWNIPVMGVYDLTQTQHTSSMYYVMPGLKFYPTSWKGKVKYAVGPSVVLGAGTKYTENNNYYILPVYPYQTYQYPYSQDNRFLLGIMVNNSLNFLPTHHLYIGLEYGLGFTYINKLGGANDGVAFITQGGFKMGYRF